MLTVIPSSFFTLLLISSAIFLPSPFSENYQLHQAKLHHIHTVQLDSYIPNIFLATLRKISNINPSSEAQISNPGKPAFPATMPCQS